MARKFLVECIPLRNGAKVLDICIGTATLITHLQTKVGVGGQVVGLDFSRGMLQAAQEKTRKFTDVHLVEADAGTLPFATGSFDAVGTRSISARFPRSVMPKSS